MLINLIVRLLSLPVNSYKLVIYAINGLYPYAADISRLIGKYLFRYLLDRSYPSIADLDSMVADAKKHRILIPFRRIVVPPTDVSDLDSTSGELEEEGDYDTEDGEIAGDESPKEHREEGDDAEDEE